MLKLKRMLSKTAAIAAAAVVAFGGLIGLQAVVPGGVQEANAATEEVTLTVDLKWWPNGGYEMSVPAGAIGSKRFNNTIVYYYHRTIPGGYYGDYETVEEKKVVTSPGLIPGVANSALQEAHRRINTWAISDGCVRSSAGYWSDPLCNWYPAESAPTNPAYVCGRRMCKQPKYTPPKTDPNPTYESKVCYGMSSPTDTCSVPGTIDSISDSTLCVSGKCDNDSDGKIDSPVNPDDFTKTGAASTLSSQNLTINTDTDSSFSENNATVTTSGSTQLYIHDFMNVPAGLNIVANPTTGVATFSGNKMKPGTYVITQVVYPFGYPNNKITNTVTLNVKDTTAPVIQPISDKTLKTDSKITPGKNRVSIPFQITDNSGVYIVSSVTGLPKGLSWTKSGISGNIDPSETGKTFDVTVNAEDTIIPGHPTHEINKSSKSFRITVVDGTEPDIGTTDFAGLTDRLEPQPGQVSREVSFELVTGDNSGVDPDVSFSRPLPDGLKYDKFTKMITGRLEPHTFLQTPYRLTVTAKDTAGNVRNKLMTVTISDGTEPQITFTDQTANTGDNFSYTFPNVSDNSGNKPKVTLEGIPRGLGWNDVSYTLSGTILPELARNNGVNKMTVVSRDLAGNSTNPKVFTLKVIDTTPPEIPEIIKDKDGNPLVVDGLHVLNDDTTTTEDVYTRQIVATDNSESDLKYDISGLPLGIGYDEDTGLISGMTKKPGIYPIDVKVTDPSGNTSVGARYYLTVLDKTLPSMVGDPQSTGETSVKNEVELQFSDNDGFPPSLELGQMPQNNATQNIATEVVYDPATGLTTLKVTVIARTPGVREFPVTVTDRAGNAYTDKVVISIVDTTPPTISGGPFKCETGKPCNKKINVNDNSGGKTTVNVDNPGQLPPGVTIDADGNITGSTDKPGEYRVDVTAKDESGNEAKAVVVIIVTDSTPPTVTIDGKDTRDHNAEYTLEVGTPINPIRLETSDNSGETPRLEFGPLPDGLQFAPDRKGGTISGTPIKTGDYTTHATLTDPSGNITRFTILFHIIDTTAPKATGGEGSKTVNGYIQWTVEAGTDIELKINVKDNNPGVKPLVSLVSGKLPDNTELSQDGVLKGKPRDIGVYNSIWRVADPAGNKTDIQVRVNVVDTTPPMIVMPKTLSLPACETMVNLTYPIQILDSARNGAVEVTNTTGAPDGLKYSHADFIKDRQFFGILGKKAKPGTVYHPEFTARDKAGNLATETGTIKIVACTPEEIEKALRNAPQVPDGLRDGYPNADISGGNNVGGNIGPRASAGTLAKTGVALGGLALVGAMAGLGVLVARKSRKQMK